MTTGCALATTGITSTTAQNVLSLASGLLGERVAFALDGSVAVVLLSTRTQRAVRADATLLHRPAGARDLPARVATSPHLLDVSRRCLLLYSFSCALCRARSLLLSSCIPGTRARTGRWKGFVVQAGLLFLPPLPPLPPLLSPSLPFSRSLLLPSPPFSPSSLPSSPPF
eukprot:1259544-Rhodomonas_salina.1